MCSNLSLPNSDCFAPGRLGKQHEDSWVVKSWLHCPRSLWYRYFSISKIQYFRGSQVLPHSKIWAWLLFRHEICRTWWAHSSWASLQAMSQGRHLLLPMGTIPVLTYGAALGFPGTGNLEKVPLPNASLSLGKHTRKRWPTDKLKWKPLNIFWVVSHTQLFYISAPGISALSHKPSFIPQGL